MRCSCSSWCPSCWRCTDGGDHDSLPLEAAQAAAAQQVSIYTEKIAPKAHRQTTMARRERFIHRYHWPIVEHSNGEESRDIANG